jgi:hypothetical protein
VVALREAARVEPVHEGDRLEADAQEPHRPLSGDVVRRRHLVPRLQDDDNGGGHGSSPSLCPALGPVIRKPTELAPSRAMELPDRKSVQTRSPTPRKADWATPAARSDQFRERRRLMECLPATTYCLRSTTVEGPSGCD